MLPHNKLLKESRPAKIVRDSNEESLAFMIEEYFKGTYRRTRQQV